MGSVVGAPGLYRTGSVVVEQLGCMGLVALWHIGSFRTRD